MGGSCITGLFVITFCTAVLTRVAASGRQDGALGAAHFKPLTASLCLGSRRRGVERVACAQPQARVKRDRKGIFWPGVNCARVVGAGMFPWTRESCPVPLDQAPSHAGLPANRRQPSVR